MKKVLSYDELVKCFIAGVEKTRNVDYSDKNSVKRNNKGVTEYRKAAKQIGELYPERVEDFSILLNMDDIKIRVCCAICMIELMSCSYEQCNRAFSVVYEYYNVHANSAEKMMIGMWLQKYRNIKQGN